MTQKPFLLLVSILTFSTLCILMVSFSCNNHGRDAIFCPLSAMDYAHSILSSALPKKPLLLPLGEANITSYALFDHFTISPPACSTNTSLLLLLIVFTRPNAALRRSTIRRTYGSLATSACGSSQVRLLFIVGQVLSDAIQTELLQESEREADIIQSAAFTDGYAQASRKGIALIHWSLINCPGALFVAKADDDCWVNLPRFIKILREHRSQAKIFGFLWPHGAPVIRDPKNKWSVSVVEFPLATFPPYVSGILYAFHRDVLGLIAQTATKLKYLFHDDVFLTGIIAEEARVGHVGLSGYDVRGDSWKSVCSKRNHLTIHYVDDYKMQVLWNDTCATYQLTC